MGIGAIGINVEVMTVVRKSVKEEAEDAEIAVRGVAVAAVVGSD